MVCHVGETSYCTVVNGGFRNVLRCHKVGQGIVIYSSLKLVFSSNEVS